MIKKLRFCLLVMCLVVSCSVFHPPGKCNVQMVLLSPEDFPSGTLLEEIHAPIAAMPQESASIQGIYGKSPILYEVARYPDFAQAEKEFSGTQKRAMGQTDYGDPWEMPPELVYSSSVFQQYYAACAKVSADEYQCRMTAQSHEYYVFFSVYISESGVTLERARQFLEKIDARAAACMP